MLHFINKIVKSSKAPKDENVLWLDLTNNTFKIYKGEEEDWVAVGDNSLLAVITFDEALTKEGVADAKSYRKALKDYESIIAKAMTKSVGLNSSYGIDWGGKYARDASIVTVLKNLNIPEVPNLITPELASKGEKGAADALEYYKEMVDTEKVIALSFTTISESVGLDKLFIPNWLGAFDKNTSIVEAIIKLKNEIEE